MNRLPRSKHLLLSLVCLAWIACGRTSPVPDDPPSPQQLFAAARAGDVSRMQALLEAGVPVDSTDRYGATPLIMAAGSGHADAVKFLMEAGADLDRREEFYGANAMSMALFGGHPELLEVLVRGGADDRETALDVGAQQGSAELARAAVESGPIYESRLQSLLDLGDQLPPEIRKILAQAETRPDPPPPTLSAEELARYTGKFEGQTSDTMVIASVDADRLMLDIDGGGPVPMSITAENTFESEDGGIQASFYGRAGTVEGLGLRRGEDPPVDLRHSIAEPAGAAAFRRATASASSERTVNWPAFRGPNATGNGDGDEVAVEWDLESGEGISWNVEIEGLGNSSPVVWGDRVFLTTAVAEGLKQEISTGLTGAGTSVDEDVMHSWRVLALDKHSGELLWETEIGRGRPRTKRHFKATQANSTPVTDGEHLVVVFPTAGMACLDLDGNIRWKHDLGGLNTGAFTDPGIEWGFASSPILHGTRVILQADTHDGAYLAAWDLESGREAWRVERDVAPGWSTPSLLRGPDGDELIVNASTIHAYDPENGAELWSLGPNSELVIAAPVVGDGVVYISAGYPPVKPIYAVRAGTRGALEVDPMAGDERLAWSHGRGGAYMPTPILYRGIYYIVHHNGRMVAYDAATGTAIYKSRFSRGGVFTGSPVAANGRLYLPTEEGLLYVLQAGPEYEELAVNDMGEPLMATPAISEGILLLRTPTRLVAVAGPGSGKTAVR